MKKIPVGRKIKLTHAPLVVSACNGPNNLVHLSIAIRNTFGYCVCWKTTAAQSDRNREER